MGFPRNPQKVNGGVNSNKAVNWSEGRSQIVGTCAELPVRGGIMMRAGGNSMPRAQRFLRVEAWSGLCLLREQHRQGMRL